MREKVMAVLDEIRPDLKADGGDVELVDVKDGVVSVRVVGNCDGACSCCSAPSETLKYYVERVLKSELPDVKEVVNL